MLRTAILSVRRGRLSSLQVAPHIRLHNNKYNMYKYKYNEYYNEYYKYYHLPFLIGVAPYSTSQHLLAAPTMQHAATLSREAEIRADIAKKEAEKQEAIKSGYDAYVVSIEGTLSILRKCLEREREHQRHLEALAAAATATATSQGTCAVGVSADAAEDESRVKRWKSLNVVLNINKKAREGTRRQSASPYSYVHWNQVVEMFNIQYERLGSKNAPELPEDKLVALQQYLSLAGSNSLFTQLVMKGGEKSRLHLITPVLVMVFAHFDRDDVEIFLEPNISGNQIRFTGLYEFLIMCEKTRKYICVTEVKKEDFGHGTVHSLMGCEALCEIETLPAAYGIATNFLEWYFFKSESERVTMELLTIQLDAQQRPSLEGLRLVANKIIAILEE